MGLEIAELMLEVEERYAIEVDEDDAVDIRTFGDLVDMVKRQIDEATRSEIGETVYENILSSFLAELRSLLPADTEVAATTKLTDLKPFAKRRNIWPVVRKRFPELPDETPAYYHTDKVSCTVILLVVITWVVAAVLLTDKWMEWGGMVFFIGMALFCWFLRAVHRRARTVGDVAKDIVEKRQRLLRVRQLSKDDIESELREMMCESFALKPEEIRRESELVKDLQLG